MSLKHLVNQKFLTEISEICDSRQNGSIHSDSGRVRWKVLVVDHLSSRILSACSDLNEVIGKGIALIEDIARKREPLQSLEAIYFISPCKSIKLLQADFEDKPLYDAAHVFFTSTCPDDLFAELRQSACAKYIRTLKEINASFIPYESRVFSLDCNTDMFGAVKSRAFDECADQLATICVTLGEYPRIGFRTDAKGANARFAALVQQKLDSYKATEPNVMREGRSQLVIVDRGFDCITPLIHDLSFQSMIYDLLDVQNDVYRYTDPAGANKEMIFNESNRLWSEFRHKHIAVVNSALPQRVRRFNSENKLMESDTTEDHVDMAKLSRIVKELPRYQKEKSEYIAFLKMTEDCMDRYTTYVNKMCLVEQDIAMGTDVQGANLADATKGKKVFPLFLDPHIRPYDKIRIILLYILSNSGITEDNLDRLLQHAKISVEDRKIISNLPLLGIDMDPARRNESYPRKDRLDEDTYDTARWTPVLKDIMEDAIENRLNTRHFQYLSNDGSKPAAAKVAPKSLRYGSGKGGPPSNGPSTNTVTNEQAGSSGAANRLIVYVLGGLTYSEMRCAYEVNQPMRYDVIVGSDQIMTPNIFLENLRQLVSDN